MLFLSQICAYGHWGSSSMPAGCSCFSNPSSSLSWPQCTSGVWGAHARYWGLKIVGKIWEHRLGWHGLVCKRAKASCQLSWLWAVPAGWVLAEGSSPFHQQWVRRAVSGLWETQVTCPPTSGCAKSPYDRWWWSCLPHRDIVGSLVPTFMVPGLHSPAGARDNTCLRQRQVGLLGECSPFPTQEAQRHRLWDASSGIEMWWA